MRQRYPVVLGAGGRWPTGGEGGTIRPFNWVKIDNKGSNAVSFGLNANFNPGDKADELGEVGAGKCRVFNVAGPYPPGSQHPDADDAWPDQIYLASVSGTTVVLEVDQCPIVDMTLTT